MYIQEGINVNVRKLSIIKSWVVKRGKTAEPEKAVQRNNRRNNKIMASQLAGGGDRGWGTELGSYQPTCPLQLLD